MSQATVTFRLVTGVKTSERRAIGFLKGHPQLNAADVFESVLNEKSHRAVLTSMDSWVDGAVGPANRFHGWPNDKEYKMCFAFKVKQDDQGHRLYGYLCHPQPKTNPRFQLCVLCIHAIKNEQDTDRAELARVKEWSESQAAKDAIRAAYPDEVEKSKSEKVLKWKQ